MDHAMKPACAKLAPVLIPTAWCAEYAERFYIPAFDRGLKLAEDNLQRARRAFALQGCASPQVAEH